MGYPMGYAWHACLAYMPGIYAWHICLAYMSGIKAWHICQAFLPGAYAWHICHMPGTPNMGLTSPFGHHFGATFLLRFGLIWKIPRHFWYFLAQNFVAHLSGWARLMPGATTWSFFLPELVKWTSSWEGRKSAEKVENEQFSEWSCLYQEMFPDPPGVFCARSRPPTGHMVKQMKIRKIKKTNKSGKTLYMLPYFATLGFHGWPINLAGGLVASEMLILLKHRDLNSLT